MAESENLDKSQRLELYRHFERQFPSGSAVTRAMIEQWLPNITDDNATQLLLRRNMEAANAMASSMAVASARRQQRIMETIQKQ